MNNDINIGLRKEGFWERVNSRKGFSTEIWIGEVVISTFMSNVVFKDGLEGIRKIELEGVEVSFAKDFLRLTFDFDRFWKMAKGNLTTKGIADKLNAELIDVGVIVKNWDSIFTESVSFNSKINLSSKEHSLFRSLLFHMKEENIVKPKNFNGYVFERNEYKVEFEFGKDINHSIVYVNTVITDTEYLDLNLGLRYEFCDICLNDALYALNLHVANFFDTIEPFRVDSVWIKVLEILASSQMSNSSKRTARMIDTQSGLASYFGGNSVYEIYEEIVGISLYSVMNKFGSWIEETEKAKSELLHAQRYLSRNEKMIQDIQSKFKISKTLQDYDEFEDYEFEEEN